MEGDIHVDSPLQYASIQIISMQNRYEVFVCGDNKIEKLETGVLDDLLPHLPALKDLYAKGSSSNLKLQCPENLHGSRWFTKSTLIRFLRVARSPELITKTKAIREEMSQLEEARKFQVSVPVPKVEGDLDPSDTSRNELLRAMDLRFAALRGELASAFSEVASSTYSAEEISNLAMFSRHFGAAEIESSLRGILKSNLKCQKVDSSLDNRSCPKTTETRESMIPRPINSEVPVQYNVSPAKVAQVERDGSTTGSDDSSESDSEGRASAERSRALARSGSRRRSASPMRRVQIGRSGPRKPAALAIKSLGFIPGRERGLFAQEESTVDEEGPEQQTVRRSEGDVKRMSVQDKIKIFESKQRDQSLENESRRSLATIGANKSVLRRWSAGMGEPSSSKRESDLDHEDTSPTTKPDDAPVGISIDEETPNASTEVKDEREDDEAEGAKLEHADKELDDKPECEESDGRLTASVEWTRQKEAELNVMLMKMMETKRDPQKSRTGMNTQEIPLEQRGGFYDQYKQKRDEKLQGENAGKRAKKEAQFKAMQEVLNERKAAMASANVNGTGKKVSAKKPQQKTIRSVPAQPAKPKKEASIASVTKKTTSSRTSPLPPTRKSWPVTPPAAPRGAGISPAKTPSGLSSTGNTPTRRKPQPTGPSPPTVALSKPTKVEKPQVPRKTAKETPKTNSSRSSKGITESKKVQPVPRTTKTAKTRPLSGSSDGAAEVPAKPSFHNKVTKKGSVVPLESKPSRKSPGSVASSAAPPVTKKKLNKPPEAVVVNAPNPSEVHQLELIDALPEKVSQHETKENVAIENFPVPDASIATETRENGEVCEVVSFDSVPSIEVENVLESTIVESIVIQAEEDDGEGPTISPMTWVEIGEEQQEEEPSQRELHYASQIEPSINALPQGSTSPRIRHSLSQMLQEESSEPDITDWGNAENPPSMIFQKDAPKGLKRLLKFARKSKGDGNSSGWSSPSVYSEGEDDSDDPRTSGKRNTDNLLLKAALHAKNFGHPKTFHTEGYDKHLDAYDQTSGSHKLRDGSSAASTTKATRSFFSLSAFRGNKPNETKLR